MKSPGRLSLLFLAVVTVLAIAACDQASPTEPGPTTPAWLQAMISTMQSEPVTNPPSAIYSYRYRGDLVYFRPARCCDLPSQLFDRYGQLLCTPDGGLAGGPDPRCADFLTARRDERLIWRDPRS